MVTDTPTPVFPCSPQCRPPRHVHVSLDLQAAGIPCPCGANAWGILYGGPLPAAIVCLTCYAQSDLEQLLIRNGRAHTRGWRG